jgi:predicted small integral membrane protein
MLFSYGESFIFNFHRFLNNLFSLIIQLSFNNIILLLWFFYFYEFEERPVHLWLDRLINGLRDSFPLKY